jgi:hypothetical protein
MSATATDGPTKTGLVQSGLGCFSGPCNRTFEPYVGLVHTPPQSHALHHRCCHQQCLPRPCLPSHSTYIGLTPPLLRALLILTGRGCTCCARLLIHNQRTVQCCACIKFRLRMSVDSQSIAQCCTCSSTYRGRTGGIPPQFCQLRNQRYTFSLRLGQLLSPLSLSNLVVIRTHTLPISWVILSLSIILCSLILSVAWRLYLYTDLTIALSTQAISQMYQYLAHTNRTISK